MTKKSFFMLVLTVAGGLMFALGMCMCLLPEWNAFVPGVVMTALGAIALLALGCVKWVMAGKKKSNINWNLVGKIAYAVASALVLGLGMAMIMAFEGMMISGLIVGIIGILLALGI
ncbi:MAG: hypothetical protein IJO53_00225, partial [Clostridia bacterium]|nr:hypothetical protein [Clostridia bacterium]